MPWTVRRKPKLVPRLLIVMMLTATGLGALVAVSFVIHFPSRFRGAGADPWHVGPDRPALWRPAGEADAGQIRRPAHHAVGA